MSKTLKSILTSLVMTGALALGLSALAPAAQAASCGGGVTYNRLGEGASFQCVMPMRRMNCASARYVVDKWLRHAYQRSYSHRLPTGFYDGYVSWSCWKRSNLRWQCDEYDSGTSFRFTAYRF